MLLYQFIGDCNEGPGAVDSLIVGHSEISADHPEICTEVGYFGPKLWGSNLCNTKFVNFDKDTCAALSTCSQCKANTAGTMQIIRLWVNTI